METKLLHNLLFYILIFAFGMNQSLLAQQELGPSPLSVPQGTVNVLNTENENFSSKVSQVLAAPGNDNCASATVLTVGAALTCGETTNGAGTQSGECIYAPGGGMSAQTVWYRITATNDSLVLNFLRTNTATFNRYVTVYGPFAPGAGCLPACTNTVYTAIQNGDAGSHILLTGLSTTVGNNDYLIQVQGFSGGGPSDPYVNFCINVANPANNSISPANASIISSCGTTYNGTTNGGYYPSGTGTGFANLDGNSGTTCGSCTIGSGSDVTFVINNISWFKFCTVNAGSYNVQFNVTSCVFTGLNSGSQMAILTGTNTSLTNIWQATNPTYTSTPTQTSPDFSLAAGGCAYLVVDGFAGDACSYNYVLSNVSGGCILLPIELVSFKAYANNQMIDLNWATATEKNNDYFTIERSADGLHFESIGIMKGAGNSTQQKYYYFQDRNPLKGISYYRLKQTDFDKKETYSVIQSVSIDEKSTFDFALFPNPSGIDNDIRLVFNGKENDVLNLSITDISGKVLSQKTFALPSSSFELNLKHHFDAGIYFAKVSNEDGKTINQKIIIQ